MDTCGRKIFRLVCVSYNLLKSCRFVVGVDYGGGSVRVGYKRVSEAAKGRKVGDACNYPTHPNCNGPGASRQALMLPTDEQSDWKMAKKGRLKFIGQVGLGGEGGTRTGAGFTSF